MVGEPRRVRSLSRLPSRWRSPAPIGCGSCPGRSRRRALLSIFVDDRVVLMKDRILGLPRTVFFLGLTSFFNDFSSEMVASIFPAFFISVLKTGAESLGLVEGIADAASNLIKIYSGRWSDRIERRKIFAVAGYTLSDLTRPFYVLAGSVGAVIGLRLTDRIGKGLRDSPRDALISLSTPKEEIGRSFGYHRAMDTLGAIVGPLVAYVILSYNPMAFNSIFITAFVIGLLAVASLWLVQDIRQTLQVRHVEAFEGFSRRVYGYLISIFILSIGTLPMAVLLLKTRDLGNSDRLDPALLCDLKHLVRALFLARGTGGRYLGNGKDHRHRVRVFDTRVSRSRSFLVARGISRWVSACRHFLGIYRWRAAFAPFGSRRGSIPGNGLRLPECGGRVRRAHCRCRGRLRVATVQRHDGTPYRSRCHSSWAWRFPVRQHAQRNGSY